MPTLDDLLKEQLSRVRKPALQDAIEKARQSYLWQALKDAGKPIDLAKVFNDQ